MAGKRRRSPPWASVLVSLVLGAVVLGLILDRYLGPAQRRAVKPPVTLAKAKPPSQPSRLGRTGRAFRLPPPPQAPAKIKPPERKSQPQRPRALAKVPVAKPPPAKRAGPAPPRLVPRAALAPTSQGLKPKAGPTPNAQPKAASKPKPRRPAPGGTVLSTRATRREGRTLLRLLEYGKGPTIEIAWPENEAARDRLYRKFRACFGMLNAVMTTDGRLFGETGPRGVPWDINLDRYSGFIRYPAGRTIAAERARARDIAARHGIHGRLVRVFPRNVDAVILGGLNQVIGGTYRGAKTITAAYWKRRGRLVLGAIKVNGRPRAGAVDISAVKRRGCLM